MTEKERFSQDNDIPFFSLLPVFEDESEVDLWTSSTDQHPNERGHTIAAETIIESLEPRGFALAFSDRRGALGVATGSKQ